jgi:predicted nucleic-acid-binding Zn-ribbon protein
MKSGKCPKCQSRDIRVGPASAAIRAVEMSKFSVSFWKSVAPERHVCMSCGYMEQYVAKADDRAAIAAKWPRATGK